MGGGMDDLLGLLGGSPAPAPAAPAGMDAMMAMMGGPAMSMGAAPAAPPGSFQAWSKDGLQIMFMATKDPSNPSVTRVEATFNNSTGGDMEGLNFQVAVPKYMQLQMKPPSSTAVTAGSSGSVKQLFQLANSMHGQKPVLVKLKIDSVQGGAPVSEQAQPALQVKSVAAELLYEAGDPYSRKIFIDRGARQGVVAGAPVINEAGVLGQVTEVYPLSAVVTLLTDRDAAIPVLNTRTQQRGAAFGGAAGGTALELRFMAGNADVQAGDALTTSGVDGVYPPGLPVARVTKVDRRSDAGFASILLAPVAAMDNLRHMLVLEPMSAQMPPRPPEALPPAPGAPKAGARASGPGRPGAAASDPGRPGRPAAGQELTR
jgi:hypothetical protein